MYLKSISTQGFKSFAKKINIDLSQSVTGVVGPNGSGKSNVAEAIRFVLGEQSMKGLRSKTGSDLIFKGSAHLSPLNRASVSITLDNSDKKINEHLLSKNSQDNDLLVNFISLDEIVLTREIYSDGASEYFINGTKVRLKDVQELLAIANISAAGHTIVNQGEADRILLSNNRERREMIEDALGLRIYHLRIKEGEKKLDKVKSHLNEIDLIRRENAPHLNSLRKQVKELEKREEEIENIKSMLEVYLSRENNEILEKKKEISHNENIEEKISDLENKINSLEKDSQNINLDNSKYNEEKELILSDISTLKEKLSPLNSEKDSIYKELINLNLEIRFLEKKEEEFLNKRNNNKEIKEELEKYFISRERISSFEEERKNIWNNIFHLYEENSFDSLGSSLVKANENEKSFFSEIKNDNTEVIEQSVEDLPNEDFKQEIEKLKSIYTEKETKFKNLESEVNSLNLELDSKQKAKSELEVKEKESVYQAQNNILSYKLELEKLHSQKENISIKTEIINNKELEFDNLLKEMSVLIGSATFRYKNFKAEDNTENIYLDINQHDLYKKIERSKMRIEETGVINAGDILEEYKTLSERDEFLRKEIEDLESSRLNLENLIKDLKDTLLLDFNSGLEKINFNFNNYFNEIFPGGRAGLSIEKIIKTKSGDGLELEDEEEIKEPGIEISINLPQKKVKDLQMLSGGERALSSIALIFAMSSINHPPFMVLDETDAALDESNARKYGKMIRKLAENSKLLVITHNRETMNQCDVLYGVTISADGSSKLLSIKFDQATEYAK